MTGCLEIQAGQIIATSQDLTPNGGLYNGTSSISGKPRLVKFGQLGQI